MCLMDNDRISRHVREKGYWVGCDHYVEMWHSQRAQKDNSKRRNGGDKLDVVVEVGANMGACTLQLLLQTNATVLAFEPSRSPLNLFHLTESLHRTALGNPLLASRVAVFPIAVGDINGSDRIFVAMGNAGNSVVHEAVHDHSSQDMSLSYPIEVRTLDSVLSARTLSSKSTYRGLSAAHCRVWQALPWQVLSQSCRLSLLTAGFRHKVAQHRTR
jgi:FkbM family methyltransferase